MVKRWYRWFDITTSSGAYNYVVFMFGAAVLKLTLDFSRADVVLGGYLWGLLWVVGSSAWSVHLLRETDMLGEDGPAVLLARRGGIMVATIMICGVAVR